MFLHRQVWYRWKARYLAVLTPEFQIRGMKTGRGICAQRRGVGASTGVPSGAI